ncbi:hypothetical protein WALSEDRAFT_65425 [Wallemia mellicola CBS 633.66]|uniref:lytic cellulose monooxygenase (C4-dehydrogenating) n=1 Tax=Wallemia mellicola (strain ATCC MYA-4683 / CBS 633.66) TaxID=671144 RepID=I4Y979_WALMC|nr:hypothetical protein WALSEDRAFT_65425 [Wallemia mellicola CBS 633.66]EIM20521.1 hypothetical protein WALSEDRAFT_65425 [Wallemia mellicola CBS 633.66]|eukprot:XP_006959547.1 hypothetical protein WALSEDRAFT_65425 [Wallemia mellicola CBS 633.66]
MFSKLALASLAAYTAAHGVVSEVWVGDQWYNGANYGSANDNSPVRAMPSDGAYVAYYNVNTDDIVCGTNGQNPVSVTADITAGDQVKLRWKGDRGPTGDYWGHYEGPVLDYLMRCDGDCTQFYSSYGNARVYKIWQAGLDSSQARPDQGFWPSRPSGNGLWAMDDMSRNYGSWHTVTIPESTPEGQYILRHELINLSSADDLDGTAETPIGGPQYYPACVQLNVKAKDGVDPIWAPETPARSMYSTGDAIVNIYTPGPDGIENFDIPGPAVVNTVNRKRSARRFERHAKREAFAQKH